MGSQTQWLTSERLLETNDFGGSWAMPLQNDGAWGNVFEVTTFLPIVQLQFISEDEIAIRYDLGQIAIYSVARKAIIERLNPRNVYGRFHKLKPGVMLVTTYAKDYQNESNDTFCNIFVRDSRFKSFQKLLVDGTYSYSQHAQMAVFDGNHVVFVDKENITLLEMKQGYDGTWVAIVQKRSTLPNWSKSEDHSVGEVSACRYRVAIRTRIRVILFDLNTDTIIFQHSVVLPLRIHSKHPNHRNLCLTEDYVVYANVKSGQVTIANASTGEVIRRSQDQRNFQAVVSSLFRSSNFMSVTSSIQNDFLATNFVYSNHIFGTSTRSVHVVTSLTTGEILLKRTIPDVYYACSCVSPQINKNGLLLVKSMSIPAIVNLPQPLLRNLPSEVNQQASPSTPDAPVWDAFPANYLQTEYFSCLRSSDSTPKQVALSSIQYRLCSRSFSEYYFAHRILMLAVQDGNEDERLPRDPHYGGDTYKWYESLYSAGVNMVLSDAENSVFKEILREAKHFNVIESGHSILGEQRITTNIHRGHQIIQEISNELALRLSVLEGSQQSLHSAFARYVRHQGISQAIGVALNLIPFLGGSIASIVGAAVSIEDICNGFDIKDVVEATIQMGEDVVTATQTFEQRLLKLTAQKLNRDEVSSMKMNQKEALLTCLNNCGTTTEELRLMLSDAANGNFISPKVHSRQSSERGLTQDSHFPR